MNVCMVLFANHLDSNVCLCVCECVDLPEPSQSTVQSKSFMNILKYMHRTFCIRVFELKIQSFNVVCMHDSKQYLHYTLHYFVCRKRWLCRLPFLFWDFFSISTWNDCRLLHVYKQILDSAIYCPTTTGTGYQMV